MFEEAPEQLQEFIGRGFYERVVRLGQRTAEMHLALASDTNNTAFTPEHFTANYQRSLYSSLRKLLRDRFNMLESTMSKLDPSIKDVAGMMRSFHYAAFGKLLLNENYRDRDLELLEQAAEQWQHYISRFYLGAYMEKMGMGTDLSKENDILIRTFLLEKAIYEPGYELNGRPDWTIIPLRGIYYLVNRYIVNRYIEEREQRKKKPS